MGDAATLAFYETQALHYTAWSGSEAHRHLEPFLNRLDPEARVLELGCGSGRDAIRMIDRGFQVDPTDGTPAMVQRVNNRFGLKARLMQFDDLDADACYDAVWAHACLLHAPQIDLPDILAAIHRALRPGGLHFANYKLGNGEGRDKLGRLNNFPSGAWLELIYRRAGFAIIEVEQYEGQGCDGTQRDWLALTVKKQ